MDKITLHDKTFRLSIPNSQIEAAIEAVAAKINQDFAGAEDIPVFLCVLNGAVMFTGEMMKRLSFPAQLVSVKMSSYVGTKSTGTVLNMMGLTGSVEGKRVIIFEDVVDTGNTIVALKELLMSKGASEVRICTMLFKPDVYKMEDKIDYVGMSIPNDFIVGFGLDYDELGRNLPDIYVLEK